MPRKSAGTSQPIAKPPDAGGGWRLRQAGSGGPAEDQCGNFRCFCFRPARLFRGKPPGFQAYLGPTRADSHAAGMGGLRGPGGQHQESQRLRLEAGTIHCGSARRLGHPTSAPNCSPAIGVHLMAQATLE
jgi:hypothetical protein